MIAPDFPILFSNFSVLIFFPVIAISNNVYFYRLFELNRMSKPACINPSEHSPASQTSEKISTILPPVSTKLQISLLLLIFFTVRNLRHTFLTSFVQIHSPFLLQLSPTYRQSNYPYYSLPICFSVGIVGRFHKIFLEHSFMQKNSPFQTNQVQNGEYNI